MGNPDPMTCDIDNSDPGDMDVIQELNSVPFTRNSQVAGTGTLNSGPAAESASPTAFFLPGVTGLGASPVGALAMARKIGLALSSF